MEENIIYESWKTTPKLYSKDMHQYQNWFDSSTNLKESIGLGYIDLHTKIITPEIYKILGNTNSKKCLEIGFGGGRLLNAACKVFNEANGIDIHECFDVTEQFLLSQNSNNYKLFNYNDIENIKENTIDFVYSFIVFQHFSSIKFFYSYIDLIDKVLTKDGCCNLHLSKNNYNDEDYYFKSINPGEANSTIFYKPDFVNRILLEKGFEIVEQGQMTKTPWTTNLSGQFYVIFKRKQ